MKLHPWGSHERLERILRRRVLDPKVRARLENLRGTCQARIEYEPSSGRMHVDPYAIGIVQGTLHELVHKELHDELERWGDLEEVLVLALENAMWARVWGSRRRFAWWRAACAFRMPIRGAS